MQVLREALLQSLPAQIMQFSVIRNKILCLTQNQLILLCIDSICKKTQIPYCGSSVYKIEMSKDYVAILQRTGRMEIRKVDLLNEVIRVETNIKIANSHYPKMKWWQDDLHLVYQKHYATISVRNKQKAPSIQTDNNRQLIQLQFTDLFADSATCIFYIFRNMITVSINQVNVAAIALNEGDEIKQVLRLSHPLQEGEYNKQYLAVLIEGRVQRKANEQLSICMRVYNILTLGLVFEKHLPSLSTSDHPIETQLFTDQLCEYLLIKQYRKCQPSKIPPSSNKEIQSQSLLKINSQYYYSPEVQYHGHSEPFFMFDIEIGLKKDLKLFPSHMEEINGAVYDSVDTCYFENNHVYIASIVLQTGYKNEIYHRWVNLDYVIQDSIYNNQIEEQKNNQLVIWNQLVEAKINPNNFLHNLITASELHKYSTNKTNKHHHVNTIATNSLSNISTNNLIDRQHESIIQSLLSKLHKINNFTLPSQKVNAYQTMKKILAIQYFPMLLDVMQIPKDENKTQREILQKSNSDFVNTMSGCSSSVPQSPRSDQSTIKSKKQQKQKQILKDLSDNELQHPEVLIIDDDENIHHCQDCLQIEDHQNLQLTLEIMNESSKRSDDTLAKIEQTIHKMETVTRYRLQRIEMKTRRQKRQSKKVVSMLESEFHSSLTNLNNRLIKSAKKFTQKISTLPEKAIQSINQHTKQTIDTVEQKRLLYENSHNIHKENHQQLLDYLYDIEFPQIGFEPQPKSKDPFEFFNISELSKSLISKQFGLDRTLNQIESSKQKNDDDFKLFSQLFLKNFM